MTIRAFFDRAEGAVASKREGRQVAEWLLREVLSCNRADLYAHPQKELSQQEADELSSMLDRYVQDEPLQYITGKAYFYGLPFRVNSSVLIPRPETEILVDEALKRLPEGAISRVIDIGTGSGCIPIAIAHERPEADVTATDISSDALKVARSNAQRNDVGVEFLRNDIARGVEDMPFNRYDLIISNPPYVPTSERETLSRRVKEYEPGIALFVDDPMEYFRYLNNFALQSLWAGGSMLMEVHAPLAGEVVALMKSEGWHNVEVIDDLAGRPRIVSVAHG